VVRKHRTGYLLKITIDGKFPFWYLGFPAKYDYSDDPFPFIIIILIIGWYNRPIKPLSVKGIKFSHLIIIIVIIIIILVTTPHLRLFVYVLY
jgi:hypothetical protein